ncbi:hypothetical protein [Pandoraea soli]
MSGSSIPSINIMCISASWVSNGKVVVRTEQQEKCYHHTPFENRQNPCLKSLSEVSQGNKNPTEVSLGGIVVRSPDLTGDAGILQVQRTII